MPRVTLTDITVSKLPVPARGQVMYVDKKLAGFGCRVSQGGRRTFVLVHGEKRQFTTIGRYPIVSLAAARTKAKEILAQKTLSKGKPPSLPFPEALDQFLKGYQRKPSTMYETERLLRRHFPFIEDCADITTQEIVKILDGLRPSEANHAFTALRTFFRWAASRRYCANPLDGLKLPHRTRSRDRVLSMMDELRKVLATARQKGSYGQIVELLILTGQRAGQIASLRGEYVTQGADATITWPAELMKGNAPHTIPLGARAAEIIGDRKGLLFGTEDGEPFNNWSASKKDLDKECPLPHWTLHDLRRTFATHVAEFTPPHVLERILAHTGGTISGVAAIYNRHKYMDEMKACFGQWESKVQSLLAY